VGILRNYPRAGVRHEHSVLAVLRPLRVLFASVLEYRLVPLGIAEEKFAVGDLIILVSS
jgi:hypothetical protein